MTIERTQDGRELNLRVVGRLDTNTAPEFERELGTLENVDSLNLDFAGVEYVSSAGLRVLLSCQKLMSRRGGMVLKNVAEPVMEVLEITGFSDILTIK